MRIKEAIKQKGMTIKEVAKELGITTSALNQTITGNPSVRALTRIANVLNVPVWQFFVSPEEVGGNLTVVCPKCGTEMVIKAGYGKS